MGGKGGVRVVMEQKKKEEMMEDGGKGGVGVVMDEKEI